MNEAGGRGVSAVLLDWDGTLVDTREVLLSCWRVATTQVLGRPFPVTPQDTTRVLSLRAQECFPPLAREPGDVARLGTAFQDAYNARVETVRAFDGIPPLLEGLRHAGTPLALVTSKAPTRVRLDQQASGLGSFEDVLVSADDVSRGKPDPQGVFLACERLGVRAVDVVVVGDSPADVAAGRAAGARTVAVTYGLHPPEDLRAAAPDHIVAGVTQLRALFSDWGLLSTDTFLIQ